MYGALSSCLMRELHHVNETQLGWRHYLWRYIVQTPIDFNGFDRRFVGRKIYLDVLSGESVQVVVGVDTRVSIMDEQMQSFLGEVQGILGAYPHFVCDLFYIDTEAHGPYRVTPHSALPTPIGGGDRFLSVF
jgi:predicted metal-dependent peptidase